jgi:hypothetical protein
LIAGGTLETIVLVAWTFLFTVIGLVLHELAHALTYRLMGVPVRFTLNTTTPDPDEALWPATLSGPTFTLFLGCLGAFVFSRGLDQVISLAGLGLAVSQLSVRPALHLAMLSGRMLENDEVQIADALGLPRIPVILGMFAVYASMLTLSVLLGLRFGVAWWSLVAAFLTAFLGTVFTLWLDRRLFGA